MLVRVKFIDSIAGLADVDTKKLDEKYAGLRRELNARPKPPSEQHIKNVIEEQKKVDRYNHAPIGFPKDYSFRPGEEHSINSELAEKWAACGICVILENPKKAA